MLPWRRRDPPPPRHRRGLLSPSLPLVLPRHPAMRDGSCASSFPATSRWSMRTAVRGSSCGSARKHRADPTSAAGRLPSAARMRAMLLRRALRCRSIPDDVVGGRRFGLRIRECACGLVPCALVVRRGFETCLSAVAYVVVGVARLLSGVQARPSAEGAVVACAGIGGFSGALARAGDGCRTGRNPPARARSRPG